MYKCTHTHILFYILFHYGLSQEIAYSEREWKTLYNSVNIIFYDSMIPFYTGHIGSQNIEMYFLEELLPNEMDSPCRVEILAFLEVFNHKQDHYLANRS